MLPAVSVAERSASSAFDRRIGSQKSAFPAILTILDTCSVP